MHLKWEDNYTISVKIEEGTAVIFANKGGMLSLANHLRLLAEELPGNHIHLDEYNSLEDGSAELILVRTE